MTSLQRLPEPQHRHPQHPDPNPQKGLVPKAVELAEDRVAGGGTAGPSGGSPGYLAKAFRRSGRPFRASGRNFLPAFGNNLGYTGHAASLRRRATMSKRLWYVAAAVALTLALGWFSYWIFARPSSPPSGEMPTLRVGSHTTILSAALDVTAGKDYFGREGLRVLLDHQESSKITMPALISGSLVIAIGSNSAGSFNQLATGKIQLLADAARVVPRLLVRQELLT